MKKTRRKPKKSIEIMKQIEELQAKYKEAVKKENEELGALIRELYEANNLADAEKVIEKFFEVRDGQ